MIRIEPCEPSHIQRLDALEKGGAPQELLRMGTGQEYDTEVLVDSGPAYAAMEDETVLLCGGIIYRWAGLWDAWCIMSPFAVGKPSLHKLLREEMEGLEEEFGIRRLQAFVRQDYMAGIKYMEFLEFEPEAVLRKYGPAGENMIVYVRFGNGI